MNDEIREIEDIEEEEVETINTEEEGSKEAPKDPKKVAIEMLKEGRPIEEIMEKTGLPDRVIYGLKGALVKQSKSGGSEEEGGIPPTPEEEAPLYKSPKEQLEEWFISEISKRLPDLMGKKYADLVIKTLKDNPDIIWEPQTLRYHIVQINPKINKYLLDWILNSLYRKLNELKSEYEGAPMFPIPMTPPPMSEPPYGYGIRPPRGRTPFTQRSPYDYGMQYYQQGYSMYQPMTPPKEKEKDETSRLIILALKEILDKLDKKEKEEPMVDVPFGDKMIKVPASQAGIYITMNAVLEELKKLSEKQGEEPVVKVPTADGKVIELPATQAVYYVIAEQEKEKRRAAEETAKKIMETYAPQKVLRALEESAFGTSPSPTIDLLNKVRLDLNKHIEKILSIVEIGLKREIKPEMPKIPRYSQEEREKKMEEVSEAIKEAQEQAQLENDIQELVPYVVGEESEE